MSAPSVLVNNPKNLISITRDELAVIAPASDLSAPAQSTQTSWLQIVSALQKVARELECPPAFHRGFGFPVALDSDLGQGRERLIADLWFTTTAAPTLDLTTGELDDEHHWLAHAWAAEPTLALPVHLTVLTELAERERLSEQFASTIREQAAHALRILPAAALWRSPLAAAALYQASRPEPHAARTLPWTRLRRRSTAVA